MRRQFRSLLVLLAVLFAAAASASVPDPPIYLTANWPTPDPAPVTTLEQALLTRLTAATLSIDAALYDFTRPSLGDALLAAKTRGVTVRIVTDDEARASATSKPFYDALAAGGIPIVDDGDDTRIMHDKYAIIDHQVVWTGSTNWSENDIIENHNNAVAFASADVAAIYQHDFDQMIAGRFGGAKTPSPTTSVTYDGSPLEIYFSPQDNALSEIIAEVNAAQATVDFAIFFFTDDDLRDALIAAKARGVRVRGIFDELGAGNASSDDEALCAAGVPVRVEQTGGKLHNKLMVLDAGGADPRVVTGSLNWTAAGDAHNSENIVILRDAEAAQTYTGGLCAVVGWLAGDAWLRGQRAAAERVPAAGGRRPGGGHAGAHVDPDGDRHDGAGHADAVRALRLHGQPVQLQRLPDAGRGAGVFRLVHAGGGHGCAPAGQ